MFSHSLLHRRQSRSSQVFILFVYFFFVVGFFVLVFYGRSHSYRHTWSIDQYKWKRNLWFICFWTGRELIRLKVRLPSLWKQSAEGTGLDQTVKAWFICNEICWPRPHNFFFSTLDQTLIRRLATSCQVNETKCTTNLLQYTTQLLCMRSLHRLTKYSF